jgi:hypothetical protein
MPDGQQFDLTSAAKDPDFLQASVADKMAFLSAHDRDFAAASTADKAAYLNHILGNDRPTEFEKQNAQTNFGREANEFNLGLASAASGLPESTTPIKSAIQSQPTLKDAVLSSMGPLPGLATSLYNAGKSLIAPSGTGEDAALERAHAAGTVAGTVAPLAIGEGVEKVGEAPKVSVRLGRSLPAESANTAPPAAQFNPALNVTPAEVLQHAAQNGIDLTPGQATKAPLARTVQAIGERSIFDADKLTQGIDRNAGAFMQSVRNFADRSDPKGLGLSEEQAGESIQQSAQVAKQVAHENAQEGYKQIQDLMPEKVNPKPITNAWMDLRENLPMGAEDNILAQVPRNMKAVVSDLLGADGKPEGFQPTFEQAIKLRSMFRELGETPDLPNSQQGIFRQMSKSIDSAMEKTADNAGRADDWRDANAGWKDYTQKYGDRQSPLYKILNQKDPALITRQLLNRGSAADVETLNKEGMATATDALKRQVIEDIARNKFTVGRDGLGGYSDSFLNTLFGPQALKELYVKSEIGRRFTWEMNPSGTSNVMLGESQLTHPQITKLAAFPLAAKASMPRPATAYLPRPALQVPLITLLPTSKTASPNE